MLPAGLAKDLVVALGTGTMITAVVGFGQTLITASATQRAMVTPLIEENRRALQELSAEYRSLNSEFFPTHVFDASDEPDPAFNQLLMTDLRGTRQYFFRGFAGRHAAARLLVSQGDRELRAVMADPTERSAITGRARYLLQHRRRDHGARTTTTNTGADNGIEALQRQLQEEIHVGLVGLFLARSYCTSMHVTLIADPPLDRVEMFDDSTWITLYSDADAVGSLYPRTLRFSEGSFIYNMERAEFARLSSARSARHMLITPDLGRREFATQFEHVTGARLGTKQFTELAERFHHFRQEFSTLADLRS
ncbi:hypothetical protein [Pseudonocardia sp. TRM90224]|uniref:hypothetical protein n=1 Tax=Pseudonocardia sp. TRM90224 TaxID=2812678 RepID=UPI001E596E81|nr:hypothetical protein [Pseudonocardia sp. TRM90224]